MPAKVGPLVLVVDPDQSLQELFRELFQLEGYAVDVLPSLHPGDIRGTSPAAVVFGLGWGEEAASIAVLRSVLDDRPPGCSVVVCTADPAQIEACQPELAALGIPVVSKPFNIEDLLGIVQDGIAGRPSADGRLDGHQPS